jgi:glycosyltransferase involved in cell wall biosynthesis
MNIVKCSVIIPCSRPAGVQPLLDALLQQTLPSDAYEIIIVVPCYAGEFPISDPRLRVVQTTGLFPPGYMRNSGAKAARADFFCFIDDDCVPPPDWLERMIQDLESDAGIGLAGCRIKGDPPTFWNRCADYSLFPDCQSRSRECFGLCSGALAARREAMSEAGGFDNDLTASEDWDLSVSVKSRGWKLFFNPDMEVLHRHGRGSPVAILCQSYRSGRSSGLSVQRRHPDQMTWMARISVRCSHPLVYMFWMPFAALLTGIFQIWKLRGADPLLPLFLPMILAARFFYQLGVWSRLFKDRQPDGLVKF